MRSSEDYYQKDPLYRSMMERFQHGEWEQGFLQLDELINKYPAEEEIVALKRDMELRARFDEGEVIRKSKARRQRIKQIGVRFFILALAMVMVFAGFYAYNNWFLQQFNAIRQGIEYQERFYSTKVNFDEAQQLLAAFRPQDAQQRLELIQSENPGYPGLDEALKKTDELLELERLYNDAVEKEASGDMIAAFAIFQEIEAKYPNYRDVTLKSREIQREFDMNDRIQMADSAVKAGEWDQAILYYEEVRNRDPQFEKEDVERKLYYSYLTAAQEILASQPESLDALEQAQVYYIKALSLRPQDAYDLEELNEARNSIESRLFTKYIDLAQAALIGNVDSLEALREAEQYFGLAHSIRPDDETIVRERDMAKIFLQAQADFKKKNWSAVIAALEKIYEFEPGYAGGTARQTLYDALILRGDYNLQSGGSKAALADYQRALAIAELNPESRLRQFEAQVKIGNILGIMGSYQAAIIQYRSAIDMVEYYLLSNIDLLSFTNQADDYFRRAEYKTAFTMYRDLIEKITDLLQTTTIVVSEGDYLTKLANTYNTTVSAIMTANNLTDPGDLSIGARIIIPVIP